VVSVLERIALDGRRQRDVREAALHALRSAKRPELIEFYGQIAKHDEDPRIRLAALYQIGMASKQNEAAAYKLLKEYATDRNQGREVREAALSSHRSLRGSKVAEVYMETAKSDPDEHIQQLSLHYFVEVSKDQPEQVFSVLKEILQDRSRSSSLRETAMYQLARTGSDEALNLLVTVAQTEPEERLQASAVSFISHLSKNKSKSLKTLLSLFQGLKRDQTSLAQSLLYAIASIGNEEAVDFIGNVARTHEDYDLRRTAIQFLGSIGGEKARTILVEIMNSK
jgi:HEAT repeat protein